MVVVVTEDVRVVMGLRQSVVTMSVEYRMTVTLQFSHSGIEIVNDSVTRMAP